MEHVHVSRSASGSAGIRYEHSHRLIASTVGFLTIILAIWTWWVEPRRWVRVSASRRLAPSSCRDARRHHGAASSFRPPCRSGTPGWRRCSSASPSRWRWSRRRAGGTRVQPAEDPMLRRVALATTALDLHADPRRRDDAAQRRGAGDSRLPPRVRPRAAAGVEREGRDPFRAPCRRARRHAVRSSQRRATSSITTPPPWSCRGRRSSS